MHDNADYEKPVITDFSAPVVLWREYIEAGTRVRISCIDDLPTDSLKLVLDWVVVLVRGSLTG